MDIDQKIAYLEAELAALKGETHDPVSLLAGKIEAARSAGNIGEVQRLYQEMAALKHAGQSSARRAPLIDAYVGDNPLSLREQLAAKEAEIAEAKENGADVTQLRKLHGESAALKSQLDHARRQHARQPPALTGPSAKDRFEAKQAQKAEDRARYDAAIAEQARRAARGGRPAPQKAS